MADRGKNPSAEAQKRYRKANDKYRAAELRRVKARYRALSKLARKHPEDYNKLYKAELNALEAEMRKG